jgi:hypothetical protein
MSRAERRNRRQKEKPEPRSGQQPRSPGDGRGKLEGCFLLNEHASRTRRDFPAIPCQCWQWGGKGSRRAALSRKRILVAPEECRVKEIENGSDNIAQQHLDNNAQQIIQHGLLLFGLGCRQQWIAFAQELEIPSNPANAVVTSPVSRFAK